MITKQYRIQLSKHCIKDLEKIPTRFRKLISKKIDDLSIHPRPDDCKQLQGSYQTPYYRIRCGDYRIVYTINDGTLLVLVITVGHRKEIYRRIGK